MPLQIGAISALNVGLALLVGSLTVLFGLRSGRSRWASDRRSAAVGLFKIAAIWTLCAAIALLWTQAALMAEVPLFDAAEAVGQVLLETHFGHAWIAGIAALVMLIVTRRFQKPTLVQMREMAMLAVPVA
ncbi:MAG: hypothetical protein ABIN08_07140, partial [Caldimonas sp.]